MGISSCNNMNINSRLKEEEDLMDGEREFPRAVLDKGQRKIA